MTVAPENGGVRLWLEMRFRGLLLPLMTRSLNRDRAPAFEPMPGALTHRIDDMQAIRRQ